MAGWARYSRRPPGDLEIGVLEHVGRVNAPLQPPVKAEPDHPPQPLAVPGEQFGQRPLVPPSRRTSKSSSSRSFDPS